MVGDCVAESFEQVYDRVSPRTLIGKDRMQILWETAQQCAGLPGDIVEVGVHRGGSALLLHAASPEQYLYLFDSFAGHPATAHADESAHHAGRFSDTSKEEILELFAGPAVEPIVIAGEFPASLARVRLPPLALIHCDVDLYESTSAVLKHLWPLLLVGGALICDDYGFEDCPGAKRAIDEFVAAQGGWNTVRAEYLPTRQARLWRVA